MKTQTIKILESAPKFILERPQDNERNFLTKSFSGQDITIPSEKNVDYAFFIQLLNKLVIPAGKKSFLVFKKNKFINVITENIAYFCIKYDSATIVCFDKQEYFLNYSLDQLEELLPEKQFFRLNRQYLINFDAIITAEHYFARKLLVTPVIPTEEKLLVSKEKVSNFLHWLDNR